MKYQPPFDPALLDPIDGIHNTDAEAPYVNGDPRIGRQGSIPPAASFEHHMRELVHLITYSQQTPSHTDLEQVRKAIKWMIDNLVEFAKSGDGVDLYHGPDDGKYFFRSLVAGDNITLTVLTDVATGRTSIKIDSAGGGGGVSGESNTGSNLGTGAKVFKQKTGVDFQFRSLKAGSGITLTEGATEIEITKSADATPTLGQVAPVWLINEERLGSAGAYQLPINAWTKRNLNTTVGANQIAGATLVNGQVTLPAGSYRAQYCTVVSKSGFFISRLYNVTAGAEISKGTGGDANPAPSYSVTGHSIGIARFTLAAPAVIELQSYSGGSVSPNIGYAGDSQNNVPPFNHVDGWLEIVKEA